MIVISLSVSTSKSRRYSLLTGLPSFAPETRANSVCWGPVVAVQLRRNVVGPELAGIVPRSTVSTICSAADGEPLCTSDKNAFPEEVPTFETSTRTVCVSGASTRPLLVNTEPAPSNCMFVTAKSGPARPLVVDASANGRAKWPTKSKTSRRGRVFCLNISATPRFLKSLNGHRFALRFPNFEKLCKQTIVFLV